MKHGLDEKTIEKIRSVLSGYPEVEKAVLYGSRAKGNFKRGSDIDLTLCGGKLTLNILNKIEDEIDDLLMPYKVDLSIFERISNTDLLGHIERVGVILYKRK